GRKVQTHERVDRLGGGVDDVDEALVGALLEVLAAVLVLVGRTDDRHDVLLRREGHRAHDLRTSAGHGVDDLARRRVDDLVVIRLQANADLLSRHCLLTLFSRRTSRALDALTLRKPFGPAHPRLERPDPADPTRATQRLFTCQPHGHTGSPSAMWDVIRSSARGPGLKRLAGAACALPMQ